MKKCTVDNNLIQKLEKLAYIRFSDKEKQALVNDIDEMIKCFETINEIDTDGVEPLINTNEEFRVYEDKTNEVIFDKIDNKNAPDFSDGFYRVIQ